MRPSYWHVHQNVTATSPAAPVTASSRPAPPARTPASAGLLAPVDRAPAQTASHAPLTWEGPGAARRRGLSSPVPTWSPELSRSVPAGPHPRVVRLPKKISPPGPTSILGGCHSNEGCCEPEPVVRIKVR